MGKRFTLMLAALLAVSTVIFIIISIAGQRPDDSSGQDHTAMTRTELTAMIVVNPNRHEAREQLALLDLREGNAPAAVQNMLILAWASWDMTPLELQLEYQIRRDHSQGEACLILLGDQRKSWLWPKEMTVLIGAIVNKGEYVLDNLPQLLKQNPEHPLAIKAFKEFQKHDLLTAWEIGSLLGTKYAGQVVSSIVNLPLEDQEKLSLTIIDGHPNNLLARLLQANLSGGTAGLADLLALEDEGLKPWDSFQYSRIKLGLIFQAVPEIISDYHIRNLDFIETISWANQAVRGYSAPEQNLALSLLLAMEEKDHRPRNTSEYSSIKYQLLQAVVPREAHHLSVTPEFFVFIQPPHMLYLIENWLEKLPWAGYDEHGLMGAIDMAAGILSQEPGWTHVMTVVDPPSPPPYQSILESQQRKDQGQIYQLSLSPDGHQLIYFTAKTIWWYDLVQEEYRQVQTMPQVGDYYIHWAPDSRTVILERQHPEIGNVIQYFSVSQTGIVSEVDIKHATVLGWQDNNTLLISTEIDNGYRVSRVNQNTGQTHPVTTLPHRPTLTSAGKIAWTETNGNILTVSIQDTQAKYSLPQADLIIDGWLPGDRGVLLQSSRNDYYVLDFATGNLNQLDVNGSFLPHASSWRSDNTIMGTFSLGLLNHVMLLDLEDMSLRHTGVLSYYGGFSGNYHYWHIHSGTIYIYRLQ